jgi:Region found in RelA / SpoT proteins
MISIISKLMRNRDMKVTTMQDIGGCRAIVKNIGQLRRVLREFESAIAPNLAEPFVTFDYLSRPKPDGYRGVHYVIKYAPRHPKDHKVPSRRIEIQLRSGLQHRWAMAVETVDLFTGQTLKLGGGSQKWRRFFMLISCLFAEREGCPRVPGTEGMNIKQEAETLWEELRVPEILMSWISLPAALPVEHGTNAIYLVQLDVDKKTTSVVPFSSENIQEAYSTYFATELKIKDNRSISTVLVSAGSATELRESFPSYYGHATSFIIDVNQALQKGDKPSDDGQTENKF